MKESQKEKILSIMAHHPDRMFRVSDFMRMDTFIGYKAGTRISDLCREGKVSHVSDEGRFALYQIVPGVTVKNCERRKSFIRRMIEKFIK